MKRVMIIGSMGLTSIYLRALLAHTPTIALESPPSEKYRTLPYNSGNNTRSQSHMINSTLRQLNNR